MMSLLDYTEDQFKQDKETKNFKQESGRAVPHIAPGPVFWFDKWESHWFR